ncbi:MAG: outer membrane protein assembly factor BamA [Opitutae bacterium]|nr:outer membrane protein assembly factor BamA [Opitutae bacterium]|tara:strand:- start:1457 stop:3826 length:2370 start_codon:yes stop_codon:yes gene_type:complete
MFANIRILGLVCCLLIGWGAFLLAQVNPAGKRIAEIRITIEGPRTIGESFIRENLQVEVGAEYHPSAVDKSIRNLMATGTVDDVRVFLDTVQPDPASVVLAFRVTTKPRIGSIRFEGNDELSDRKLAKSIESEAGELLDEAIIKSDERAVRELYLDKGFWNSRVESEILRDEGARSATVVFRVVENESRKIRKIVFEGNKHLSGRFLRKQLETAPWRFWRFWSKRSKYRPSVLEEDLEALRKVYRDEGFLDIVIVESSVEILRYGNSALDLVITLVEGERSYAGKINVTGNAVLSSEDILKELQLREGDVYSPTLLGEDRNRIRKRYGQDGYLDARVIAIRKPNLVTGRIDVTFDITENNKFTVNSILVRGNDKTRTIAIVRELALAPSEIFDLRRMETSEARLRNTRFFERVTLDDEPIATDDLEIQRSRRNLVVNVKEGRTGHVSFGVGFSTLEKAMMFAEFRQGNFDLFRWRGPHRLQGDGQKFRLRLKLGARSSEARLAFEEPWFLNRRLAAGFEVFREKSDYYSSYYDEMRAGFEIYARRRLFELVEGRLFYSYEDVVIDDLADSGTRPGFIKEEDLIISKVGITLTRDTRDSILFPTEGSILSLRKEFAGGPFGGEAEYGRLELQGAQFFKTSETMEQVLSFVARAGTLGRYNGDDADVPFFEKFFLGGPYNLRGWDYRDAGPQNNVSGEAKEPTGGNSFAYLGAEYTFKIAQPLRLALFYDAGYLNAGDFDFDPSNWYDNWGFGARIMVMGMPLRLDLGFPLSDPTGTGGSPQFHFSGGTRF